MFSGAHDDFVLLLKITASEEGYRKIFETSSLFDIETKSPKFRGRKNNGRMSSRAV